MLLSNAECNPIPRLPERDLEYVLDQGRSLWEDLRNQSIFLTGGTGFVGTWLVETLVWAHDRQGLATKVVILTRDPARYALRSPHLAKHPAVRLVEGDITTFPFPEGEFPLIVHAATHHSFQPNVRQPLGDFEAEWIGTRRILDFARSHGVRRFLLTSSGAVYGKQPSSIANINEEYAGAPLTTDTGTGYGQAKRVAEFMSCLFGKTFEFDVLTARLFAFVGPLLPLDLNFAAGNFVRDALAGGPIRIAGDGTPYRSYLYAADLALWLWTILLRGRNAIPYNVGSSHSLTIAELAQTVVRTLAPGAAIEIAGRVAPGTAPARYVPSTIRAETELGLQARISLEEGIRRMADWARAGSAAVPAARASRPL
jgi:dTDP-glucose 4,6-dehydratase